MNILNTVIDAIDRFQRKYKPTAFLVAIVKKYGDDQAGYQAALVTYYGFLSLFPLLLILTTLAGIAGSRDPELGSRLVDSVSSYFPVIGQSLDDSVKGLTNSGPALVIGILFAMYGTRGIADAFRNAVNHIWHIPTAKRSGFPRSLIRSFGLIIFGGGGFIAASIIAGWAAHAGHNWTYRILSIALNLAILYLTFLVILRMSLPLSIPSSKFRRGAAVSAVGLASLQLIGGLILTHEAHRLASTYTAVFATTLGLLAWIYLQAQVIMYAVVVDTVSDKKLWPRGLSGRNPTAADTRAEKRRELV